MRKQLFTILLLCLCSFAGAEISPFTSLGSGHFSGKMSVYAHGDTLASVYNDNPGTDPAVTSNIVFSLSTDGGTTWENQTLAQTHNCLTQPTLSVNPDEMLITYTVGTEIKLLRSLNGGNTWQPYYPELVGYIWGRTFENGPFVERRDGVLKLFNLDIPYPEYDQDSYCHPEHPEELIAPHLFTDIQESPNQTPAYYFGQDVITGSVRCNTEIWIKKTPSYGTNDGWPTFLGPVIIGEEVQSFSGAYQVDQVFPGGLIENAPYLGMKSNFDVDSADIVGPEEYDTNRIMYVEVDGSVYTAYMGIVQAPHQETAGVYNNYPPGNTPLYSNTFAVRDTVWTLWANGSSLDTAMNVNSKLWIKGTFSSHQTWIAADTIFLIGDILLSNTPAGADPADNNNDIVNLVSDKSIVLKYGYRDPVDSLRIHPFCRADDNPSRIYANLYALGYEFPVRRFGAFTFEYQHPHPSVPDVWVDVEGVPTLFDKIDLHRRHFPQTTAYHWPENPPIDFPWYNPLWPERTPYLERGTIQVWGSINQRVCGFMHRVYDDMEWPAPNNPPNISWNQPMDYCGGSSSPAAVTHTDPVLGIQLTNINYPGTTGTGIGYKKDYRTDNRHILSDLDNGNFASHATVWELGLSLGSWSVHDEYDNFESYYLKHQLRRTHSKAFARYGNNSLYSVNDLLIYAVWDSTFDWTASTEDGGMIRSMALAEDGSALVCQDYTVNNQDFIRVRDLAPQTGSVTYEYNYPVSTALNDVTIISGGHKLMARYENDGHLRLWKFNPAHETVLLDTWELEGVNLSQYNLSDSKLCLVPSGESTLDVFLWLRHHGTEPNRSGDLWHARAEITVPVDDPVVPPLQQLSIQAYPNPCRGILNIRLKADSKSHPTVRIYNIRGQLVQTLSPSVYDSSSGFEFSWNGSSDAETITNSGIYYLKAGTDGGSSILRRVCFIK
jgi:hypothetical protein